jgi:hypothetical protein
LVVQDKAVVLVNICLNIYLYSGIYIWIDRIERERAREKKQVRQHPNIGAGCSTLYFSKLLTIQKSLSSHSTSISVRRFFSPSLNLGGHGHSTNCCYVLSRLDGRGHYCFCLVLLCSPVVPSHCPQRKSMCRRPHGKEPRSSALWPELMASTNMPVVRGSSVVRSPSADAAGR